MTDPCCDYRDHLCGCVCTGHPQSQLHPLGYGDVMASTKNVSLTFHLVTADYVIDVVTAALRANDWTPDREHPCGCGPDRLCPAHAEIRAVGHYHPGGAA